MNNRITIALIIAILAGFGGLVIWGTTRQEQPAVEYGELSVTDLQKPNDKNGGIGDHVRGKEDSKIIFTEYADMMCAGCAGSIFTVEDLYAKYGDRVAFNFRHFPLQGHPNSRSAAAAAESAGKQGYFWDMLRNLYLGRNDWLEESGKARTEAYAAIFKRIAPEGDVDKFIKDLSDPNIEAKIDYDYELGKQANVMATPSFYVNGVAISIDDCKTQSDIRDKISAEFDRLLAEEAE